MARVDLDLVNADDMMGPFVRHLGLEVTEVTGQRVTATWTAATRHHQPFGIVHGGVHASVVETLGSMGSNTWLQERDPAAHAVGVSNTTDFFRAVREGDLVSTATPVHQGRSQQLWDIETRDDQGRLVARGQLRTQNIYSAG
jgi:1,4-dihydroxy-2-naphthoyl-CoA hydrolase